MKYLVLTVIVLACVISVAVLVSNEQCIIIGERMLFSYQIGSCGLSTTNQSSVSLIAVIFWDAMNILFAYLYSKNIAKGYKVLPFILGLPTTLFILVIAQMPRLKKAKAND